MTLGPMGLVGSVRAEGLGSMAYTFTTAARMAANRRNSQLSTGPRTAEGKERSRANAVKHGLTGSGIALPAEDKEAVAERFLTIQAELAPATLVGAALAHQVALMTVRLQRAARYEAAALAARVRGAAVAFDDAREAEAEKLLAWIEQDPPNHRRKLLAMPEGVDKMVRLLEHLRSELERDAVIWTCVHERKLEAALGRRAGDVPHSRSFRLSRAIGEDFTGLDASEGGDLATVLERRNWATDELIALIDAELDRLRNHRATIDLDAIEADRAEAGDRALFDPGKDATLARKYEAAASRGLFRCLRELREVEAQGGPADPDFTPVAPADETGLDEGDTVTFSRYDPENDPPFGQKPLPSEDLSAGLGSFGKTPRSPAAAPSPTGPSRPKLADSAPTDPSHRPQPGPDQVRRGS